MTSGKTIQTSEITNNDASNESPNQLALEISKLILSNNFEFIRSTLQSLQTFTSLVLTAYIALLVGFRKDIGFHDKRTLFLAFSPIICWSASLFWGFATAARHLKRQREFVYGDLESTVEAYEQIVRERSKHILWPGILCLLGLVCFVIAFFTVFLKTLA